MNHKQNATILAREIANIRIDLCGGYSADEVLSRSRRDDKFNDILAVYFGTWEAKPRDNQPGSPGRPHTK